MKYRHNLFYTAAFLIVLIASMPLVSAYSLTYDANGNLITGDGKFRIYDGFNHLVQVRTGNNATATILENYTWHPLEDRILAKSVYETNGSWKEDVLYVSKEYVVVDNVSGSFDYKYYYQNGQLVAQQDYAGNKLFFHNDHLGSVSLVTNESGAVVEQTFYEPFGKVISGGTASRFQYEAKEYDSVVGDYDFHARKVNPEWGVFTQPDTIIQNVYDPQSLNRYAFEKNNPIKYTDPTGKIAGVDDAAMLTIFLVTMGVFVTTGFVYKELAKHETDPAEAQRLQEKGEEIHNTGLKAGLFALGIASFALLLIAEGGVAGASMGAGVEAIEKGYAAKDAAEAGGYAGEAIGEMNKQGVFQPFTQPAGAGAKQSFMELAKNNPTISTYNNKVSNANLGTAQPNGNANAKPITNVGTPKTTTTPNPPKATSSSSSGIIKWFKSFFGKAGRA